MSKNALTIICTECNNTFETDRTDYYDNEKIIVCPHCSETNIQPENHTRTNNRHNGTFQVVFAKCNDCGEIITENDEYFVINDKVDTPLCKHCVERQTTTFTGGCCAVCDSAFECQEPMFVWDEELYCEHCCEEYINGERI